MATQILKILFSPVVFALGFLTPLFTQMLNALAFEFAGMPNLAVGLAIALALGITAQVRG